MAYSGAPDDVGFVSAEKLLDSEMIASYNGPMNAQSRTQTRAPGRPREFDIEAAVDAAMLVFRDRGFHEASMQDLGAAMKLTPGSIYKAFGDKREIFLAAFERYRAQRAQRLQGRLAAKATSRDKLAEALHFYGESASGAEGRLGCMVVGAAADLSTLDASIVDRVADAVDRNETLLRELIEQGQGDGSIPATVDPASAAIALLCLTQGMRVIGKLGRSRGEMRAVVDQAMKMLN
nr:TetR/AcrR family transcriptional regulator [uncultured Massilia sp.]